MTLNEKLRPIDTDKPFRTPRGGEGKRSQTTSPHPEPLPTGEREVTGEAPR
jgi:hypothetical protein